jgi:hypothetical protein
MATRIDGNRIRDEIKEELRPRVAPLSLNLTADVGANDALIAVRVVPAALNSTCPATRQDLGPAMGPFSRPQFRQGHRRAPGGGNSKQNAGAAGRDDVAIGYHNRRWSETSSVDDESIVSVTAIQAMPIG